MEFYQHKVPQTIINDPRALRYRRRILHPRVGAVTPRWLAIKTASYWLMGCCAVYAVLFMDFGDKWHCFTPIRQFYDRKKTEFLTLDEDDLKELRRIKNS
jgi:hypothetical protein